MNTSNKEEIRSKITINCTNYITMDKCYDQIVPMNKALIITFEQLTDSFGFDLAKNIK